MSPQTKPPVSWIEKLPVELLLQVALFCDCEGIQSLLSLTSELVPFSRLVTEQYAPKFFRIPDIKYVKYCDYGERAQGHKDAVITLMELTEDNVWELLSNVSVNKKRFTKPLTFVYFECSEFKVNYWRFVEMMRTLGIRFLIRHEETWQREYEFLHQQESYQARLYGTSLDTDTPSLSMVDTLSLDHITEFKNLQLPNLQRLKISFSDDSTTPHSIENITAECLGDFRVHYTSQMPSFKNVQVGKENGTVICMSGEQIGFELADKRALGYNCVPRAFESQTTRAQVQEMDLDFVQYFKSVRLIGVHDEVLYKAKFDSAVRFVWRKVCSHPDEADPENIAREILLPKTGENIYIESSVRNSVIPNFKAQSPRELSIKDNVGGLNMGTVFLKKLHCQCCNINILGESVAYICEPGVEPLRLHEVSNRHFGLQDSIIINTDLDMATFRPVGSAVLVGIPESRELDGGLEDPHQAHFKYTTSVEHLTVYHTGPVASDNKSLYFRVDNVGGRFHRAKLGPEFANITAARHTPDTDQPLEEMRLYTTLAESRLEIFETVMVEDYRDFLDNAYHLRPVDPQVEVVDLGIGEVEIRDLDEELAEAEAAQEGAGGDNEPVEGGEEAD